MDEGRRWKTNKAAMHLQGKSLGVLLVRSWGLAYVITIEVQTIARWYVGSWQLDNDTERVMRGEKKIELK